MELLKVFFFLIINKPVLGGNGNERDVNRSPSCLYSRELNIAEPATQIRHFKYTVNGLNYRSYDMARSYFYNVVFEGNAEIWKAGADHGECHTVEQYIKSGFPELLVLHILRRTGFDRIYFEKVKGAWNEIDNKTFKVRMLQMQNLQVLPGELVWKERERTEYPLLVLDILMPEESKFYVNENEHGQVIHRQYIGNAGEYVTAVVVGKDELWIGGPYERCAIVGSYSRGYDILITLWIIKERLEHLRFKKIDGKWKSIPWEEFNVYLTRMMRNSKEPNSVVDTSSISGNYTQTICRNLRGFSQKRIYSVSSSSESDFVPSGSRNSVNEEGHTSGDQSLCLITADLAKDDSSLFNITETVSIGSVHRSYFAKEKYSIGKIVDREIEVWRSTSTFECKRIHLYIYKDVMLLKLDTHRGNEVRYKYFKKANSRWMEIPKEEYDLLSEMDHKDGVVEESSEQILMNISYNNSSLTYKGNTPEDAIPSTSYSSTSNNFFTSISDNGKNIWKATGKEKCVCAYSSSINGSVRLTLEIIEGENISFKCFDKCHNVWKEIKDSCDSESSSTETLYETNDSTSECSKCSQYART